MMPQFPDDEEGMGLLPPKIVSIAIITIFVGGVIIAWLGGLGVLPIEPISTLGLAIMLIVVLVCCSAINMIASYSQRIPQYGEMEIRYEEAKLHYDNEEYEEALEIFKQLAGPRLNHKRALYYGARCYEALDDWENMKLFCKAYLELKPKDKEVWEMLNRAHKKLFEYEEAQEALEKANKL
ncbi:MAG: CDC27 family protein [Candidatus Thorarchaeota archaeon]|jgi:tetratricopeptide (TPR) repeat protein